MNTNKKRRPDIKLKKHMSLGAISAENDSSYLYSCFVDTGDYDVISNTEDDRSIILGRTGTGKSALLEMVKHREENVIEIQPEELALNYISHSNVLRLLEECGVNLDPYYQLLWKHIFAVELIKYKYHIKDEGGLRSFMDSISGLFSRDKGKEAAVGYLTNWHDKFWLPVEERVREITSTIEDQLTKSLTAEGGVRSLSDLLSPGLSASAKRDKLSKLTRHEKEEVRDRVQSAVDSVQIQELHRVIRLLGEDIFSDAQQKFYVLVDKIDEDWIDDRTRYKLIRSLIDTIKTFRRIRTVKFLIAMRVDLLQTVFDRTRDPGFQEDKYRDYLLSLRWTNKELKDLAQRRVAHLFRRQYEKVDAEFTDLFSDYVGSTKTLEWLTKRTLMRPRDLIVYMNFCLESAAGASLISPAAVRDSEVAYSQERLKAVCQEWSREYPELEKCTDILKRKKNGFTHSDVDRDSIEALSNEIFLLDLPDKGVISRDVELYLNKDISRATLLNRLMAILYIVGIVGIKRDGHESAIWSSQDSALVTESEVKRSSHFYVHPMFWRVLGTHSDKRKI